MTASASRRTALGAILAAPLVSMPALADSLTVSREEAALLALAPQIVRLLDEYDRAWAPVSDAYMAWDEACKHLLAADKWDARERLPEWKIYIEARRPADSINALLDGLYEPFFNIPLTTLPAILLRHRYGMSIESNREDALADLDRLWREGRAWFAS